MTKIIAMKDVSFIKKQEAILSNIHWEMNHGEHWAILGLNGSGKTSLLNIVNGYQFPSTGNVAILGNEFGKTNLHELRKKIGFVSSSLDRFSTITDGETVLRVVISGKFASFGIYENFTLEDEKEAEQVLEQLRLSYLKHRQFHLLSQGEQRRVFIARALMSKPQLLVLDEPCSGLDILSREQILDMLDQIAENGCHIVYVTHHVEELVNRISHVLLMKDGKIVQAGPKDAVLTNEHLSTTFTLPVSLQWHKERPFLTIDRE